MKGVRIILLAIALAMSGASYSCIKGSATHKVTVGQHTLREAVGAFQDAEIAEFNAGHVSPDNHVRIQSTVKRLALAAIDLDNAMIAGASATDAKAKFDAVYALLDSLNTDGILGIKNPTTKQVLETALDGIRAIVDNILIGVK